MKLSAAFSRGAVLALLGVVTACTVAVEDPGPRPGPHPRPGPEFCTREYDPVCGRRGGDRQTFANACLAEQAGYRITNDRECRRGGGDRDRDRDRETRFCAREYKPVCATRRGNVRTFGNSCELRWPPTIASSIPTVLADRPDG